MRIVFHHASSSSLCSLLSSPKTYRQINASTAFQHIILSRFHRFHSILCLNNPLLFISHRPFLAGAWRFISLCSRYPWQSSIPSCYPSIFVFLFLFLPSPAFWHPFPIVLLPPLLDMTLDDLHIFTWIWLRRDEHGGESCFLLHVQKTIKESGYIFPFFLHVMGGCYATQKFILFRLLLDLFYMYSPSSMNYCSPISLSLI